MSFSGNKVAVRFAEITARTGTLILGCLGFQLHHASLGGFPQPPNATLDAVIQTEMVVENVMYIG